MPLMEAPPAPAIIVVGSREAAHSSPATTVSADAAQLRTTTNVRNTEDVLRYFPSLFVRKRHIGDTQAPLATRTSGVGASARSLIYADGVLLSALSAAVDQMPAISRWASNSHSRWPSGAIA